MQINNTSDIGVICGLCGSNFTGRGDSGKELLKLFNNHKCMVSHIEVRNDYPLPYKGRTLMTENEFLHSQETNDPLKHRGDVDIKEGK